MYILEKNFLLPWKPILVCKIHKKVVFVGSEAYITFYPLNYYCAKFHACYSLCTIFLLFSQVERTMCEIVIQM